MISVTDLLKWADEHAIGRSPSYPRGWISGKDLQMLSVQVEQNEPLNFYYSVRSNLPEEVYGLYTDTAGNLHWTGTHSGKHTIKAEEETRMNCKTCAGPCCLKGSNIEGDCEGYKPQTHYEQIRSMSIEEMAETFYNGNCPPNLRNCPDHDDCRQCWLDWLRLEVTE